MDRIKKKVSNASLDPHDAEILWAEKERLRVRNEELEAVLADHVGLLECKDSGTLRVLLERDKEIEILRSTCVNLRKALSWSVEPAYRYTSLFE